MYQKFVFLVILITVLIGLPVVVPGNSLVHASNNNMTDFQKGMSYATYANMTPEVYGSAASNESLRHMKLIGVEWVAINVVWFQEKYNSTQIFANSILSPSNASVAKAIEAAHRQGMRVMLKPMIELLNETDPDPWRGKIEPSTAWFQSYANFIGFFAEFAAQNNVEIFCIGTELNRTVVWELEWRNTISVVKQHYSGYLTYAAIWWKEFDVFVKWWDDLDYVGIDAYFPLSDKNDPTISEMNATWHNIANYLDTFYSKVKKPIIFTEIGYQSVNGSNTEPWNYHLMETNELDLQEQADCYESIFQALCNRPWFKGTYWWYWQTNPDAGGSNNKDYTPQNKPAQGVLTHWYHVIPEFPSTAILILVLMITTFTAIVVKKRKLVKSMYVRNISQKRSF